MNTGHGTCCYVMIADIGLEKCTSNDTNFGGPCFSKKEDRVCNWLEDTPHGASFSKVVSHRFPRGIVVQLTLNFRLQSVDYIFFVCLIRRCPALPTNGKKRTTFGDLYCMIRSSNWNIFRVTGHLCGELTGHRGIPPTKASDAEI